MTDARASTRYSIVPARPDDYDAIVSVWHGCGLSFRPNGRDSEEAYRRQLERFSVSYLVARHGDRIVGVIFGTHDGRKGWINRLAIHPDHQRRGLASDLMIVCESALKAEGIGIICAQVEIENKSSCIFFEHLGYARYPLHYYRKLWDPDI